MVIKSTFELLSTHPSSRKKLQTLYKVYAGFQHLMVVVTKTSFKIISTHPSIKQKAITDLQFYETRPSKSSPASLSLLPLPSSKPMNQLSKLPGCKLSPVLVNGELEFPLQHFKLKKREPRQNSRRILLTLFIHDPSELKKIRR